MGLAQVVATFPLYLFQRFWYRLYDQGPAPTKLDRF